MEAVCHVLNESRSKDAIQVAHEIDRFERLVKRDSRAPDWANQERENGSKAGKRPDIARKWIKFDGSSQIAVTTGTLGGNIHDIGVIRVGSCEQLTAPALCLTGKLATLEQFNNV